MRKGSFVQLGWLRLQGKRERLGLHENDFVSLLNRVKISKQGNFRPELQNLMIKKPLIGLEMLSLKVINQARKIDG